MARLPLLLALALLGPAGVHAEYDDDRTEAMFLQWLPMQHGRVVAFEHYLAVHNVLGVTPTWQLLRSASMWKQCQAAPFSLPPPEQWADVARVLGLLQELRRTGVLGPFAVVSAYRDPQLNRCAGGSPGSSHMRTFAVDIIPLGPTDDQKLCDFFREQGSRWDMGLSRYPSGRIHVDRSGFRTWGADHTGKTSFCNQLAQKRPTQGSVAHR